MKFGLPIALAALLAASPALAQPAKAPTPAPAPKAQADRKVFLNGIDLQNVEVPAQVFAACEVRFDAQGNIYIKAPGFEMKMTPDGTTAGDAPAPPPPPAAGPITQQYFITVEENAGGLSRWDVGVDINGKRITVIRAAAGATAFAITQWLQPGTNRIRLVATRSPQGGGSTSPHHHLQINIGEGGIDKGQAVIRKNLVTYRRTAAETGTFDDTFTFAAR